MGPIEKPQRDGDQQVPTYSGILPKLEDNIPIAPQYIDRATRAFCKDITTFLYQYAEKCVNDFMRSEGFAYLAEKHCKEKGWRAPTGGPHGKGSETTSAEG